MKRIVNLLILLVLPIAVYSQDYQSVKPLTIKDFYADYVGQWIELDGVYISTDLNKESIQSEDIYLVSVWTRNHKTVAYSIPGDYLNACITDSLARKYNAYMSENESDGAGGYLSDIRGQVVETAVDRFSSMKIVMFLISEIRIVSNLGKVIAVIK